MASMMMKRGFLANLIGKLFGGNRDLYNVFGYERTINPLKFQQRYRRQDIAARIVEAPANALWTNPPLITGTSQEWNDAWTDLVINKNLWDTISRVDKLAGMGDFATLLVGFDKTTDLNKPVGKIAKRKVLFLQPYSYAATNIDLLDEDPSSERYMRPSRYRFDPMSNGDPSNKLQTLKVTQISAHYSRVLHVAENCLVDEIFGNPRLERVWNLLDDLLKVAGGTAETFWLAGNKGMQVDIDKEMELSDEDAKDLNDELEEYQNQLRRVIRTRGVKINNLGGNVPDPSQAFNMIISLISGATGLPKRILLGSEAGQLASVEDRNNWAERIMERRTSFGEPQVIYPLIHMLTAGGVLPEDKVTIKWPSAFSLTPLEKMQASAQTARSAANITKAMETNPNLCTIDEAREIIGLGEPPKVVDTAKLDASVDR